MTYEESNSITMQRLLLRDYVREHFPQDKVVEFADDGYSKDPEDRHKFVIAVDEAVVVRRLFQMYADVLSTVEIARIFNEEGVKSPSQVWDEKGIRKASPKGGTYVWQNCGILRMLKNRAYVGDLVPG